MLLSGTDEVVRKLIKRQLPINSGKIVFEVSYLQPSHPSFKVIGDGYLAFILISRSNQLKTWHRQVFKGIILIKGLSIALRFLYSNLLDPFFTSSVAVTLTEAAHENEPRLAVPSCHG